MLSLLGFPGTAGFIGKWYILVAATMAHESVLATILVLTSVVSAGYYLPVIMAMYMKPEPFDQAHAGARLGRPAAVVVAVCVIGLLVLGIRPNALLQLGRESALLARRPAPAATTATRRGIYRPVQLLASIVRECHIRVTVRDQLPPEGARAT